MKPKKTAPAPAPKAKAAPKVEPKRSVSVADAKAQIEAMKLQHRNKMMTLFEQVEQDEERRDAELTALTDPAAVKALEEKFGEERAKALLKIKDMKN